LCVYHRWRSMARAGVDPLGGGRLGGVPVDLGDGRLLPEEDDLVGRELAAEVVPLGRAEVVGVDQAVPVEHREHPVAGQDPEGHGQAGDRVPGDPPVGTPGQFEEQDRLVPQVEGRVRLVRVGEQADQGVLLVGPLEFVEAEQGGEGLLPVGQAGPRLRGDGGGRDDVADVGELGGQAGGDQVDGHVHPVAEGPRLVPPVVRPPGQGRAGDRAAAGEPLAGVLAALPGLGLDGPGEGRPDGTEPARGEHGEGRPGEGEVEGGVGRRGRGSVRRYLYHIPRRLSSEIQKNSGKF
jgi:hypothetical protein